MDGSKTRGFHGSGRAMRCCRKKALPLQKNISLANRLISALPARVRAALLDKCELVDLRLHSLVGEASRPAEQAYFPVDCFVSVILPSPDTPDVEVALVGQEGMFNTATVFGVTTSAFTHLVQGAGRAFRISVGSLQQLLLEGAGLRQLLHRYVDVRDQQLARQLACGRYHSLEQRYARLLLTARDRAQCSELFMTYEVLAQMLGVRRETVSRAASFFQDRGLISYNRGYLLLLDEPGLMQAACLCYQSDQLAYEHAIASHGTDKPALVAPVEQGLRRTNA